MIMLKRNTDMRIFNIVFSLCTFIYSFSAHSEDLKIPALIGLSGASQHFGEPERDAYTLALEERNAKGGVLGKKVSLLVEDTQTRQVAVLSGFQRLSFSKPSFILGPTWLDGFQAVIPVAQRQNVLLITPSAANESFTKENSEWPISFYHNSTIEIRTLTAALDTRGIKNVALFYEQEPFAEMIRKLLKREKPELAYEYGVQTGDNDFRAAFAKLKNIPLDAIVIFVWDERSLLSMLQQIKIFMPKLLLVSVHDAEGWLSNPNISPFISHILYPKFIVHDKEFETHFEKRFAYKPRLTASNAYDAMNAVLNAYESGAKSAEDFRKYMLEEEHDTVTFGRMRFAEDRNLPSRVEVVEYKR